MKVMNCKTIISIKNYLLLLLFFLERWSAWSTNLQSPLMDEIYEIVLKKRSKRSKCSKMLQNVILIYYFLLLYIIIYILTQKKI